MGVYKIKNKDGKFSTGGVMPNFTNRGKAWATRQALKAHLAQFTKKAKYQYRPSFNVKYGWWNDIPEDWIVLEFDDNGKTEYPARSLFPETTGVK